MSTNPIAFPFDPAGAAATNRIVGEQQVLNPGDWKDFFTLIPLATPFFGASLQLIHHPSGRSLVEGVDYALTHRFHDASLACAKAIYGSFTLMDNTLTGVIEMSYQTLGGSWTLDTNTINAILANALANPRMTTWEQVVNLPFQFPVIDHEWNLTDMVGASEVVTGLHEIADTIANRQAGGLEDHLSDYTNPHHVNKTQVGLGNVDNFSTANSTQAEQGLLDNLFMTPLKTAQAITTQALAPLNLHKSNYSNPHQVTKEQVGLGLVGNFGLASNVVARVGDSNAAYMTPATTKEAIDQFAGAPLATHIADFNNPHQVTAAQIGLGNVQNLPLATPTIAAQGVSNAHYMTPALVRGMITTTAGSDITNHINNQNNPHQVNKAQVGLALVMNYPVANQAQATSGTDNATYMTPLRTAQYVATAIAGAVDSHANDHNNPHQVTASQVGLGNVGNYPVAQQSQAEAGLLDTVYMTPKSTKWQLDAYLAGQGSGLAAHIADQTNPHAVTAAQVGAYTKAQTDSLVGAKLDSSAQAADSAKFAGKTYAEVEAEIGNKSLVTYPAIATSGDAWTYLGTFGPISINAGNSHNEDRIAFTIYAAPTDRDPMAAAECSMSREFGNYDTVTTKRSITGLGNQLELSYVRGPGSGQSGSIDVYFKTFGSRPKFTVQYHTKTPTYSTALAGDFVTTEPTGAVEWSDYYRNSMDVVNPAFGYGHIAHTGPNGLETGNLLEELNVVSPADVTNAQTQVFGAGDLISMMSPMGFRRASGPLRDSYRFSELRWHYDSVSGKIKSQGASLTGHLRGSYSRDLIQGGSGTIEVEFDVSAAGDQCGGLGLCLMQVEHNGKIYSIDVVRQAGGLQTNDMSDVTFSKLFLVQMNMARSDMVDLGSTSTNMSWGDGVLDVDRASTGPYNPTGHGWSQMGVIRLRAENHGSYINVYVSEPDGPLPGTPTITIDLSTPMMTALFQNRDYRWGIIATTDLMDFNVKLNTYPGKYRSYINYGTATDGSEATFNAYDGVSWNSIDMYHSAQQSFLNRFMCRMVHSEIDGTIWYITPSGQPRKLFISAQSDQARTVLTL